MKVTNNSKGNIVLELSTEDAGRLHFMIDHFNLHHGDPFSKNYSDALRNPVIEYISLDSKLYNSKPEKSREDSLKLIH